MSGSFTALRVTAAHQVPLFEGHVRRLGEASRGPLRQFADQAEAGVYRATWDGAQLTTSVRPPSRLVEGMPTRFVVSPFVGLSGRFPKPGPPSPYEAVRVAGLSSLLTDPSGQELYEACVASVIAWDGAELVLAPEDVPAVGSIAEAEVAARLAYRRARIFVAGDWPLLLINAVVGTCAVSVPGRAAFPAQVRSQLDEILSS